MRYSRKRRDALTTFGAAHRRRRIACCVVADFPAAIYVRDNPALATAALAVVEAGVVVATWRVAESALTGMTEARARSAYSGLHVVPRNEAREQAAECELLAALEQHAPVIEVSGPGEYLYDMAGMPAGEAGALSAALETLRGLGYSRVRGGVADDAFTARCAALMGDGCTIVAAGEGAAFLEPLPVTLLPLQEEEAACLAMLGVHTLGDLARLPEAAVAARFGERARFYVRLARARDATPLQPRPAPVCYEERYAFEPAVDNLEPVLFGVRRCIQAVAARLAGASQTCRAFDLLVEVAAEPSGPPAGAEAEHVAAGCAMHTCTDTAPGTQTIAQAGNVRTLTVRCAEPTSCTATMFALARAALESQAHPGSVEAVGVRVTPAVDPVPQLGLFNGVRGPQPAAVGIMLTHLRALGAAGAMRFRVCRQRSRLPERMQTILPLAHPEECLAALHAGQTPRGEEVPRPACASGWPLPVLRLVHPPRPMPPPKRSTLCAGPFRISERWWDVPADRDYYQCWDVGNSLVLAFYDLRGRTWYVQGIFD